MARILVIHGTARQGSAIREALIGAGHDVLETDDGQRGLSLFDQRGADLVVVDLSEPGMRGMETVQLLRQKDPGLPILTLSSTPETLVVDYFRVARRLGANWTLARPFRMADFLTAAHTLLNAATTEV